MSAPEKLLLVPLPGNEPMAHRLAELLGAGLCEMETRRFPDDETYLRFTQSPQGRSVALVCTLDHPDPKFLPLLFAAYEVGYVALVGIDGFTEPGIYDLELTGGDERGLWSPVRARVPLTETTYDTQYIELGEALDGLLDPELRATEDEFLKGIYARFTDERRWDGPFQVPLTTTIISAPYGGRRSYNGGPIEIYHTGIDYAAAQGMTVLAPANGVVVFSETLDLRGGTLIIDHGMGVMTGYYHLLERLVEVGQEVTAGEPIARVGSTGLSSGPHLHWDLRVMNVTVDPTQWTQQAFP